jgi:hypothetical protein
MAQKRSSYPFHIMLGRKPAEGKRRTYEVITSTEESCSSTQAAESQINKLIKEGKVTLEEGDHLVVAQITRVRALKTVKKVSQVDEDPNDAFGDTGGKATDAPLADEEVEIEDGEVSSPDEEPAEEPEATSEVVLPEEEPEAPAAPAPAESKPAVPPAATPPPGPQQTEQVEEEDEDDPLADMEPAVDDIVDDSEPAVAEKKDEEPKSEEAPAADTPEGGDGGESDDPLDDIF